MDVGSVVFSMEKLFVLPGVELEHAVRSGMTQPVEHTVNSKSVFGGFYCLSTFPKKNQNSRIFSEINRN